MELNYRTPWDINLRGQTGIWGPHEVYGTVGGVHLFSCVRAWAVTSTTTRWVTSRPVASASMPTQAPVVCTWCGRHLM